MISYAQNFEDVILCRVFRDRRDGFYIDVGAADPVFDSVTKAFYDQGWSGINIEPNEFFYSKLLEARPRDINLNLALGEYEEARPFYVFEHFGNSTFDEQSRDSFSSEGHKFEQRIMRTTTLGAICREYVRREIDFLKIDCEGWEKRVIQGADWDRFRPKVLVIEATKPGTAEPSWSEWDPLLTEDGRYEMVYFDGLNRFYLRREYSDLRSCLGTPPNIFDGFITHGTAAAEQARQALEEQLESIRVRTAELESKLNSAAGENAKLAGLLTQRETEITCLRESVTEAKVAQRTLEQQRDSLAAQVSDLTARASSLESRCRALEGERADLTRSLGQTRLWVGRLSQDLAALKLPK